MAGLIDPQALADRVNSTNPAPQQAQPTRQKTQPPATKSKPKVKQQPKRGLIGQITHTVGDVLTPAKEAAIGTVKGVGNIASIPYDVGKTIPASITGNKKALENANKRANKNIDTAVEFARFLPRSAVKVAESVPVVNKHPSEKNLQVTDKAPGFLKALLGKEAIPSFEKTYKDVKTEKGTARAAGTAAVDLATSLLALKGGKDLTVKTGNKAKAAAGKDKAVNELVQKTARQNALTNLTKERKIPVKVQETAKPVVSESPITEIAPEADSYRSSHQITDSVPAHQAKIDELTQQIKSKYGLTKYDHADIKRLKAIASNPEADVKIYRASPENELNQGDWITTSKTYADDIKRQNGGKVYEHTVKAKDLHLPANIEDNPSLARFSAFQYKKGDVAESKPLSQENVVEAPKTQKYQTVHSGGEVKTVDGEPVQIVKGVDTFIHKDENGNWVVSEATTGRNLTGGGFPNQHHAKEVAKSNIRNVGEQKFKQMLKDNQLPTKKSTITDQEYQTETANLSKNYDAEIAAVKDKPTLVQKTERERIDEQFQHAQNALDDAAGKTKVTFPERVPEKPKEEAKTTTTTPTPPPSPKSPDKNLTPVEASAKVSREVVQKANTELQSRVYKRLKAEHPELKDDVSYEAKNLKKDAEKAVELVAKDKNKAYRVAMGAEELPDQTSTAVNIALSEKALAEKNHALYAQLVKNRSLAQTRRGQELVAEKGSVTDNSTSRYVKDLINSRLQKLGKGYLNDVKTDIKLDTPKSNAGRIIEREVIKAQKQIRNKTLDLRTAQELIDSLAC